jgi:high-affinity Fe2+/Pb2+ permease
MPNLIWPRALSPHIGATGLIGRTVHWLGVALAAAVLVTALGFAVDGWSAPLAASLTLAAVAVALVARGVRYLLARE